MSNNDQLVSIALCTYNGSAHLEEQLNSLINQTYKKIEIIVVDDCSTDNTLLILEDYSSKDQRIKIYSNTQNLGYVKNFEKAIKLCEGDFIALCDQDDIWDLDKINLMLKNIGDNILIYHDSEFVSQDGSSLNQRVSGLLNMYEGNFNTPFLFYNCVSGHSVLFKKSLIHLLLPLQQGFFHDWLIAIIATENGGIKYLDQPLVKYRQHVSSSTDILRLKKQKKLKNSTKEINLEWLRYVSSRLRNNKLANQIISCFDDEGTISMNNRVKLFITLINNYKLLFFAKKKPALSKLNYIRKICFTIK